MEAMDPQSAAAALAQELSAPAATVRAPGPGETRLRLFLKLRRVPAPAAATLEQLQAAFQAYMRANWRSEPAEPRQLELLSQHCIITPPGCTRGTASNLLAGLVKEQPFAPGYEHPFDNRVVSEWLAQQPADAPLPRTEPAPAAAGHPAGARAFAVILLLPIVVGAAGLLYEALKRPAPQLQRVEHRPPEPRGAAPAMREPAPPAAPPAQERPAAAGECDELLEEAVRRPADTLLKTQTGDVVDDLPGEPAAPGTPLPREAPGAQELDLTRKLNVEKHRQEQLVEMREKAAMLQQKLRDAYRARAAAEERLRRLETIVRVADSQIAQAGERQRQVAAMNPQPSNAKQVLEYAQAGIFSANDQKNKAGRDLPGAREAAASARSVEMQLRTELGLIAAELARNRPPAPPAKVVSIYRTRDGGQINAVYAVASEGIIVIRDDAGGMHQIRESDVVGVDKP